MFWWLRNSRVPLLELKLWCGFSWPVGVMCRWPHTFVHIVFHTAYLPLSHVDPGWCDCVSKSLIWWAKFILVSTLRLSLSSSPKLWGVFGFNILLQCEFFSTKIYITVGAHLWRMDHCLPSVRVQLTHIRCSALGLETPPDLNSHCLIHCVISPSPYKGPCFPASNLWERLLKTISNIFDSSDSEIIFRFRWKFCAR